MPHSTSEPGTLPVGAASCQPDLARRLTRPSHKGQPSVGSVEPPYQAWLNTRVWTQTLVVVVVVVVLVVVVVVVAAAAAVMVVVGAAAAVVAGTPLTKPSALALHHLTGTSILLGIRFLLSQHQLVDFANSSFGVPKGSRK